MLHSNLDNIDFSAAAATSRLSDCLATLPVDTDPAIVVRVIRSIAAELGGQMIFDFQTGLEFPEPLHWLALQFEQDGTDYVVHVLIGDSIEPFWIGFEDQLPARCAQLARDLLGYARGDQATIPNAGMVSGSIH
ncbi:MAG: hypothetical protein JKY32_13840 [Rhizobiales bacterium]|nr:hypothetical protein [Hyphomicrobiales bacterium]